MKEPDLRKWHRSIGIVLAFFIILQAATGLIISLGDLSGPEAPGQDKSQSVLMDIMEFIHRGGGPIGAVYRTLVGIGLLLMAVTGGTIFFKIRARTRKA